MSAVVELIGARPAGRRRRVALVSGLVAALIVTIFVTEQSEVSALDRWHPGAARFYRELMPHAGDSEMAHHKTLRQLTMDASAVVIAEPGEVFETRTIVGEGTDRLTMVGLRLKTVDLIRGKLDVSYQGSTVVEFVGGSAGSAAALETVRELPPDGAAVWFLRAKQEGATERESLRKRLGAKGSTREASVLEEDKPFYRLVSSQGLYIQGRQAVENPLLPDDHHDEVVEEAASSERLSSFKQRLQAFS